MLPQYSSVSATHAASDARLLTLVYLQLRKLSDVHTASGSRLPTAVLPQFRVRRVLHAASGSRMVNWDDRMLNGCEPAALLLSAIQ